MSKLNKYKLSEIAYIKMGQSPDGESCNEDGIGIPLLNGPSEFTDFYPIPKQFTINAKRFSEEGEILFCVRGSTTGRMNWSNGTYAIGRGLASITHKEGKQLNHFLKYLIHSNLDSILKAANGSTFPNLTSDIFSSFELSVPDLLTQQKIASVLSSLDAKIELNNRINTELEAMAKTLYDYWFVQFDFPDAEDKPYKSSGGAMIWSEELKREIPLGWEGTFMNKIYDFQYGLGNVNPDNGGQYPIYGSNGIIGGYDKFNNEDAPVIGHIGANCGSLIFAHGKHYATYNGVMCNVKSGINKYFGYSTLLSKDLKSRTRGSSQPFISYDMLNDIDIVIPTNEIMKNFCELINPLYDNMITLKQENQQLAHLRDWLLPMLMNGQVVVG